MSASPIDKNLLLGSAAAVGTNGSQPVIGRVNERTVKTVLAAQGKIRLTTKAEPLVVVRDILQEFPGMRRQITRDALRAIGVQPILQAGMPIRVTAEDADKIRREMEKYYQVGYTQLWHVFDTILIQEFGRNNLQNINHTWFYLSNTILFSGDYKENVDYKHLTIFGKNRIFISDAAVVKLQNQIRQRLGLVVQAMPTVSEQKVPEIVSQATTLIDEKSMAPATTSDNSDLEVVLSKLIAAVELSKETILKRLTALEDRIELLLKSAESEKDFGYGINKGSTSSYHDILSRLSEGDADILKHFVGDHKTRMQIANELDLTDGSVRSALSRIYKIANVKTVEELYEKFGVDFQKRLDANPGILNTAHYRGTRKA